MYSRYKRFNIWIKEVHNCWKSWSQGSQQWRSQHEATNGWFSSPYLEAAAILKHFQVAPMTQSVFSGEAGGSWTPYEDSESHICPHIRLQLPLENNSSLKFSCKCLSLARFTPEPYKEENHGKQNAVLNFTVITCWIKPQREVEVIVSWQWTLQPSFQRQFREVQETVFQMEKPKKYWHWREKIKHSIYKVSYTYVGKIKSSGSLTS